MGKKMEFAFDFAYLLAIFGIAFVTLFQDVPGAGLLGEMALLLGIGDLFHLVPRMSLLITGKKSDAALGLGKWITSITAALYYVLLLEAWQTVAAQSVPGWVKGTLWVLAALRILLCFMPQNHWLTDGASRRWGILRNIPFVLMGILLTTFLAAAGTSGAFAYLPLAIALSFLFYIPVVLYADRYPAFGMLMMPKTLAYLWISLMGLWAFAA